LDIAIKPHCHSSVCWIAPVFRKKSCNHRVIFSASYNYLEFERTKELYRPTQQVVRKLVGTTVMVTYQIMEDT